MCVETGGAAIGRDVGVAGLSHASVMSRAVGKAIDVVGVVGRDTQQLVGALGGTAAACKRKTVVWTSNRFKLAARTRDGELSLMAAYWGRCLAGPPPRVTCDHIMTKLTRLGVR